VNLQSKLLLLGLEAHLGYWLRRLSNHVSGAFARELQGRHVSVAEWVALYQLRELKEMTPGALAEVLGITRGAVSKVLDKLEHKQWITRVTKQEDNRVQLLSLTRQGRRILPELEKIADRNDERFFDCLEDSEKAMLLHLLQKLTNFHGISGVPLE
jgi:DNA-binding MarR family transcriptional regulator